MKSCATGIKPLSCSSYSLFEMRSIFMYCVLLIFLVLLERGADGSVEVYQVQHSASSNGTQQQQMIHLASYKAINAQLHKPRHSFFNLSAQLVWSQPGRACDGMRDVSNDKTGGAPVAGTIVFIESGNCYPETKAKHAQQRNALGVLIESYRNSMGILPYMWNGQSNEDLNIPTLEVDKSFGNDLEKWIAKLGANDTLFVVAFPDPNPFEPYMESDALWMPVCAIFGTLALIRVAIAAERLYFLRKSRSVHRRTAELAMIIQLFAGLLSFAFCLGPVQTVGVLNFGAQTVFFTFNLPFMCDINILIAYYWHRALTGKSLGMKIASLDRYKKVAIGYAIVCHLLEIASAGTRAALISFGLFTTLSGVFYVIAFTITLSYFAYTSIKLLRFMSQIETKRNKRIRRMMYMIVINCIGSALLVIVAILVASPLFNVPGPYVVLRILRTAGVELVGYSQIFIFTRYTRSQGNSEDVSGEAGLKRQNSELSMSRQSSYKTTYRYNDSSNNTGNSDRMSESEDHVHNVVIAAVTDGSNNSNNNTDSNGIETSNNTNNNNKDNGESYQSQQSITLESTL